MTHQFGFSSRCNTAISMYGTMNYFVLSRAATRKPQSAVSSGAYRDVQSQRSRQGRTEDVQSQWSHQGRTETCSLYRDVQSQLSHQGSTETCSLSGLIRGVPRRAVSAVSTGPYRDVLSSPPRRQPARYCFPSPICNFVCSHVFVSNITGTSILKISG